jgi:hypothetical protein
MLIAAGSLLMALVFVAGLTRSGSTTAAQAPTKAPGLSPTILAFLKPVEIAPADSELQKKLKERHNVAVTLLQERVNEYRKGVRDLRQIFEAARMTSEAKLDLAENAESRIAVLGQMLEVAKLIESHLQEQLKKGFGSKADLERARFARLSVEVEMLKAQQKGGAKPE